jgi:hypothetical protein
MDPVQMWPVETQVRVAVSVVEGWVVAVPLQ